MRQPFFSFVIPVYNVEKYVSECVNSILQRNEQDYELILVDDGSTDQSGRLCDELAARNNGIKVIHKENGGLSDARNKGLALAVGEYVLFVDSDDYIDHHALSEIKRTIIAGGKPDVVFLEATKFYPDGAAEPMGDGYSHEGIDGKPSGEVLGYLKRMPKFPGSACTKAIKRTVLTPHLLFETGMISEDNEWALRLLNAANSFAYCDRSYYFYRQARNGSITSMVTAKGIRSVLSILERHSYKLPVSEYELFCNASCAYFFMVLMMNLQGLAADKPTKRELYREAGRYVWVMKYAATGKTKLTAVFCRLFGLRLVGKALSWYRKIRR